MTMDKGSKKKIPVERDEVMEEAFGIKLEACTACCDEQSLVVIGEARSARSTTIDGYREIQLVVYDSDNDLLAREFENWAEFGIRQSFKVEMDVQGLPATPSRVKVFPTGG
jgi:hypothetical protein